MVPWPRLTARYLTSIQRVVRDIVYIVCTMTVVTRNAAANGSRREEERLEDEGQRIQLEKGREKIERERGDIFRRIHTCVLARGTWFVHRLEGEKRSIGWRVGRVRFQGFPRLVFQRFLSTRANRSDPFVERERGGEGEGKWGVCRKLAFYERPSAHRTLWGQWRAALNSPERKAERWNRERERENPLSGLRKAWYCRLFYAKQDVKCRMQMSEDSEPIPKTRMDLGGGNDGLTLHLLSQRVFFTQCPRVKFDRSLSFASS